MSSEVKMIKIKDFLANIFSDDTKIGLSEFKRESEVTAVTEPIRKTKGEIRISDLMRKRAY